MGLRQNETDGEGRLSAGECVGWIVSCFWEGDAPAEPARQEPRPPE